MKKVFVAAMLVAVATPAFAEPVNPYYDIKKVEFIEIDDKESVVDYNNIGNFADCNSNGNVNTNPQPGPLTPGLDPNDPLAIIEIFVDRIINIGKKIWAVVEAGRPRVNLKTDVAHALPKGLFCWTDLNGWQMPKSKTYAVKYTNGFGASVVDFSFRVVYTHGGSYKGAGSFITNAAVMPVKVNVAWGYTFNANAEVPIVFNRGTAEDPLAGMQLNINWNVQTAVKYSEQTEMFAIGGDGAFQQLQ